MDAIEVGIMVFAATWRTGWHCESLGKSLMRALVGLALGLVCLGAQLASAREAQWIWSPEHPRGTAPVGDCFFRKTIQVPAVEQASIPSPPMIATNFGLMVDALATVSRYGKWKTTIFRDYWSLVAMRLR
jgi:hypothetical protein